MHKCCSALGRNVVGQAGSCLTLQEIRNLWWEPWNVVDVGHYALPNEVPRV